MPNDVAFAVSPVADSGSLKIDSVAFGRELDVSARSARPLGPVEINLWGQIPTPCFQRTADVRFDALRRITALSASSPSSPYQRMRPLSFSSGTRFFTRADRICPS